MSPPRRTDAMQENLRMRNSDFFSHLSKDSPESLSREQVMQAIFDVIADGLMVFNKEKTVVMANEAAAKLACWQLDDLSREELKKNFQFFRDDAKTPVRVEEEPLEIALATKCASELEAYVASEHFPDKGAWMRAHAAPILDGQGQPIGAVTIFHDITERKRLERQRDCLVTLIAHDVKNHLAGSDMFFRLLAETMPGTDDGFNSFLADLREGNTRFLNMCDSLMEMSRANFFASADNLSSIRLTEVLKDAIESNRLLSEHSSVHVDFNDADEAYVLGLPQVVWQIFHNIILNAIQASTPNSSVEIRLARTSDKWRIQISDTGPGMTPEELAVLFDPARVAHHLPASSHSTGFGLYLSAMLIESQRGSITCQSVKNKGTTVMVSLPAAN
jgi:PAS domain S-box-containing protein